jgi:O-antigen/teichoic acid export membrane protein
MSVSEVDSTAASISSDAASDTFTTVTETAALDLPIRRQLILKNFLALSTGSAAEHIIKLFSGIYVRRVLGVIAIGQVSWATSIISYFMLVSNPGFQSIAKREVARSPNRAGHYVILLVLLQTILATVSFGLAVALSFVVPQLTEVRILIVLLAFGLFLAPFDLSWLLQAHERMIPLSIASVVSNALQALSLILLVHEPSHIVRYILLAYPFRLGLYGFMLLYGLRNRLLSWASLRPTIVGGWSLLGSSLPIALSQSAILLYYNSDAVFLGFTHGDQVVGLYSTAYNLMLMPGVLAQALVNAYFPALSRVAGDIEEARRVSGDFLRAMISVGFPIACLGWAVGRHVIILLFGPEFSAAGPLFEWLSLNLALIFFNWGQLEPLIAWNAQKRAFKCTLAGAISNVVANVILIPRFGSWGAVATTLIAELVVMVSAICVRRDLRPLDWYRSLLVVISICVPAAILARWVTLYSSWYVGLTIGLIIYGVGILIFERQNFLLVYNLVYNRVVARIRAN